MAPRMTVPVAKVMSALLADPAADLYGLEMMQATGLASGTLYPVLARLVAAGWVSARWEDAGDGPARRYYRLTPTGLTDGRAALAALRHQVFRATPAHRRAARA